MKKFVFWWTNDLRGKVMEDMKSSGHVSISSFLRMILWKYPGNDKKWTDADIKAFAKTFTESGGNRPGVLQTLDGQINEAFEKFKYNRT